MYRLLRWHVVPGNCVQWQLVGEGPVQQMVSSNYDDGDGGSVS